MSVMPQDALLGTARVTLTLLMALTLLAAALFAAAAGALAIAPAPTLDWLERVSGEPVPAGAAGPVTSIFAMLAAVSVLSFVAQRLLRRVIDSVGLGDPFIPANARRLANMAWLTLGVQVLSIGVAAMIGWVEYATGPLRGQFGFSLGGVLLSLVLFILARVFRQGATMREELEGTV